MFEDLNSGYKYVFTSKEKIDIFLKQYACYYYDMKNSFPQQNVDYFFYNDVEIDPNVNEVLNKIF